MVVVFFTAAVFFLVRILSFFCFWEALHDFCCFPKSVAEIEIGNIYRKIPLKHTRKQKLWKTIQKGWERWAKLICSGQLGFVEIFPVKYFARTFWKRNIRYAFLKHLPTLLDFESHMHFQQKTHRFGGMYTRPF